MKFKRRIGRLRQVPRTLTALFFLFLGTVQTVHAGFGDFLKQLTDKPAAVTSVSDSRIHDGLKEALRVGIDKTLALTSRQDGYLNHPALRISLPPKIRKMEPMLRAMGAGSQLDEWTLSMNRAAEEAASHAAPLFSDALRQMTLEDARKIFSGGDTAATDFFKKKTMADLQQAYTPIVRNAMLKYDVTRSYQALSDKLPSAVRLKSVSLENYVTVSALNGLFLTLGEQERAIRREPTARVTALLKEVFSQ